MRHKLTIFRPPQILRTPNEVHYGSKINVSPITKYLLSIIKEIQKRNRKEYQYFNVSDGLIVRDVFEHWLKDEEYKPLLDRKIIDKIQRRL